MFRIDGKYKRVIINVMSNITVTSSGYREFAMYRNRTVKDELAVALVYDREQQTAGLDSTLCTVYCDNSISTMRRKLKEIISACRARKVPYVFHIHQIKAGLYFYGASMGLAMKGHVLYTMRSFYSGYTSIKIKCACLLNTLLADKVTFFSNASYKDYPGAIRKLCGKKMIVTHHGANYEEILECTSQVTKDDDKEKVLIYVARITPVKNHYFLLDVMEQLEGCRLKFVGDDKEGKVLNAIRQRNLQDKIEITGMLERDQVYKELGKADIYVSCSTVEGFPVSVLEAMFAGLPLVLSDIEPHKELASFVDGVKVLPLDVDEWVRQINASILLDRKQLIHQGENSRSAAIENFTLDSMHRKYTGIYEKL